MSDFQKLELRVVRIITAEPVKDSDHLLRLQIDTGHEVRSVLAGIGQHQQATLPGQLVIACLNLPPRITRFGTSEAMLLVSQNATNGHSTLLVAHPTAKPGDRVH